MCPRTSKQIYAVFKPIIDSNASGIELQELLEAARKESFRKFAEDYTSIPNKSLSSFLRGAISGKEVELLQGDRLRLTPRGVASFKYVLKNDISSIPDLSQEMVKVGKERSTRLHDQRLKFAVAG